MDDPVKGMLSANEARVLGCLMEKQMTTPDYYPLTLNALTSACNQKSSRVPVMNLSGSEVGGIVNGLRGRGLVTARMDGRADKFEQHLSRKLGLGSRERAVVCVLMLRGAQTLNEIRINTGRMVEFVDTDDLQGVIDQLIQRDDPVVVRIPRASGQREDRYAQLLTGEPDIQVAVESSGIGGASAGSKLEDDRIAALEKEMADLKAEVQRLWELTGLSRE